MLVELLGSNQIIFWRTNMTNIKRNLLATAVLTSFLGFTALSVAGPFENSDKDIQRSVIKVKAEQGEEILVVVGENGERNKYEISFEELDNMDNISAKLDDLDEATKTKVIDLLSKVKATESKIIEFKDSNIVVDGSETDVFMIKTGNGEDQMRIEIDVEGDGANGDKRRMVKKLLGDGHHASLRQRVVKQKMRGKKDPVEFIKKIIDKAELTDKQIAEIKAALDAS